MTIRVAGTTKKHGSASLRAAVLAMLCLVPPAHADAPAPLGGVVTRLGCSQRAFAECSGSYCYDAMPGETSGTFSVTGPISWAFEFDFKNQTASVGEGYAKDLTKRWPMLGLSASPAVVNKPLFVKFSLLTDTQQLFVMVVATPLPEARGYSFGYGVVGAGPSGSRTLPEMDKTINTGKCTAQQ
ncbi:MAG: hypothetical protein WAK01_14630 [Methylocystis sp.]